MLYQKIENSWQNHIVIGDIGKALEQIQLQIATNLMLVHNFFCKEKLRDPMDVLEYSIYGKSCDSNSKDTMRIFMNLNYKFIRIRTGLYFDSPYSKEEVFEGFQELEKILEEEMAKI